MLFFCNITTYALLFLKWLFVIVFRRRPPYDTEDYDTIMSLVFWSLINISKDFLISAKTHCGLLDECLLDFTGRICECLIALGSFNMQFIIKDRNRAPVFFRQVSADKMIVHCIIFLACLGNVSAKI
jgi:exportin-5